MNKSRLIVIEEAHRYFYREKQKRSDLREPILLRLVREIRKFGASLVLVDQIVSLLSRQVLGNMFTFITFRQVDPSCIKTMRESCNFEPDQKDMLPILHNRTAVVFSGELSQPYLIETVDFPVEKVSEVYIRKKMKKVLDSMHYVPLPGKEDEEKEIQTGAGIEVSRVTGQKIELKPRRIWWSILRILKREGFMGLTRLYEILRMSPKFIRRVIGEMESLTILGTFTLSLGKRGNPTTYVFLKERAAELLGVKFEEIKIPGKGSLCHILTQNLVARRLRESGKKVAVEYYMNGKSADIAEFTKDETIAYEIETEPNEHVMINVIKDLEAGFSKVIIVSRNTPLQNEMMDIVYRAADCEEQSRVEFKLLRDIL